MWAQEDLARHVSPLAMWSYEGRGGTCALEKGALYRTGSLTYRNLNGAFAVLGNGTPEGLVSLLEGINGLLQGLMEIRRQAEGSLQVGQDLFNASVLGPLESE